MLVASSDQTMLRNEMVSIMVAGRDTVSDLHDMTLVIWS